MNSPLYAILGAPDPEMHDIETLLCAAGIRCLYAQRREIKPGSVFQRVHPGNAYRANRFESADGRAIDPRGAFLLIECDGEVLRHHLRFASSITKIDHHRPDDPGYGVPPNDYMRGSSLGQVVSYLAANGLLPINKFRRVYRPSGAPHPKKSRPGDILYGRGVFVRLPNQPNTEGPNEVWAAVPQSILLTAAADHCLHAAYRGECHYVTPETLLRLRLRQRAKHQRRPVRDVAADVGAARAWLRNQPELIPHAENPIPELPEAAACEGRAFTAAIPAPNGVTKIVLQGADPDTIRNWLAEQSARGREIYGDPERGFAGAYL